MNCKWRCVKKDTSNFSTEILKSMQSVLQIMLVHYQIKKHSQKQEEYQKSFGSNRYCRNVCLLT